MANILSSLTNTLSSGLKSIGQQNNQFKNAASQQNNTISRFVKDIGRYFSNMSQQQNSLNANLNDISQSTTLNSQKIDQTNNLLRDSLSIQSQMLEELKNSSLLLKKMFSNAEDNGGDQSSMWSKVKNAAAFTALGAGLTAAISPAMAGGMDNLTGGATGMYPATPVSGSTDQILKTIRGQESGGNYTTPNLAGASSASGAYQFTDGTWKGLTRQYGIGTEFPKAAMAPPQVQDQIAAKYVEDILSRHNGDVSWVPREWFAGPDGTFSAQEQAANPGQSVEGYVQKWMSRYNGISGSTKRDNDVDESTYKGGTQQDTSQNWTAFLRERSHGANIEGLNPVFGQKLAQAIAAAERITGQKAKIVSGYRSTAEQSVLYQRYKSGVGGLAAPPGHSRHERGNAVDLADGPTREVLRRIDSQYGIEDLYSKIGKDMPHFQLSGSPTQGGITGGGAADGSSSATGPGMMYGGENTGGGGLDMSALSAAGLGPLSGLMSGVAGAATMAAGGLGSLMGGIGGLGSMLPMGLGSIFGSMFSGSSTNTDIPAVDTTTPVATPVARVESTPAATPIERDDATPAVEKASSIQTAAVQSDSTMFNLASSMKNQKPVQADSTTESTLPSRTDSKYSVSSGITSSPSWYLQLAGRINNDETMKMRGGVYS